MYIHIYIYIHMCIYIQSPSASPPPCHPHSAKTFSNDISGDTQTLQRSTGYQLSSVRYYILSCCQQYANDSAIRIQ